MKALVRIALRLHAGLVLAFLCAPILVVIVLSFNSASFLTLPLDGVSWRWYADLFGSEQWRSALFNSAQVAVATTAIATTLGTMAALGLARLAPSVRSLIAALLISPLIVPGIVTGVAVYFLYANWGLDDGLLSLILAHSVAATPFVVIVVLATLQGSDATVLRAAASLGAPPLTTFRRVLLPMIAPGVLAGAVFAFMTSFDELIITLFLAGPAQRTLPLQMFDGVREQISPTITAAAAVLTFVSIASMSLLVLLRRGLGARRRE